MPVTNRLHSPSSTLLLSVSFTACHTPATPRDHSHQKTSSVLSLTLLTEFRVWILTPQVVIQELGQVTQLSCAWVSSADNGADLTGSSELTRRVWHTVGLHKGSFLSLSVYLCLDAPRLFFPPQPLLHLQVLTKLSWLMSPKCQSSKNPSPVSSGKKESLCPLGFSNTVYPLTSP